MRKGVGIKLGSSILLLIAVLAFVSLIPWVVFAQEMLFTITPIAGDGGKTDPSAPIQVPEGSTVTVTAEADPGYYISSLLIDGVPAEMEEFTNIATVTFSNVISNHTVQATFARYYLMKSASTQGGSINPSGVIKVTEGSSLTYNINPDADYDILDVRVDGQSVGAVTEYSFDNITGDHEVLVTFARKNFNIEASAGSGGSIEPSGIVTVPRGGSQDFTIKADTGYYISSVLIDGNPVEIGNMVTEATYTFGEVWSDHTISVTFKRLYKMEPSADPGGQIKPNVTEFVPEGSARTYQIIPEECFDILDVKVDGQSVGAVKEYSFENITDDHTIHATFARKKVTVTASAGSGGKISPSGKMEVDCGTHKGFVITPKDCYKIKNVLVDGVSVLQNVSIDKDGVGRYEVFVKKDTVIRAVFQKLGPFKITATAGEHGKITPAESIVECGGEQEFEIKADHCYEVEDVTINGVSQGAMDKFVVKDVREDLKIHVTFKKKDPLTITASVNIAAGGTITPSGSVKVECGEDQAFAIKAKECYKIKDVLVDGKSVGAVNSYTFRDVTTDHTIKAVFEKLGPYTITTKVSIVGAGGVTVPSPLGGTISPSGKVKVECGKDKTFKITPKDCYEIDAVMLDGKFMGKGNTITVKNVKENHTLEAVFIQLGPFTITTTIPAGSKGTIVPKVAVVDCGKDQTFKITPTDPCFRVAKVKVDGKSVGAITSYTFKNVRAPHNISATFVRRTCIIRAKAEDNGKIEPENVDTSVEPAFDDEGYMLVGVLCPLDQSFLITPDKGYKLGELRIDDTPIDLESDVNYEIDESTGKSRYTFREVMFNHSILAIFKQLLPGDLNDDEKVNAGDAILALQIAVGLITPTAQQIQSADMNGDGMVRADDVILILIKSVGLGAPEYNPVLSDVNVALEYAHDTAGKSVVASVKLNGVSLPAGGDIFITYDNSALRADDISSEPGIILAGNMNEPGIIRISFASFGRLNGGNLVKIRFGVVDDDISSIDFGDVKLYGPDGRSIDNISIKNGLRSYMAQFKRNILLQNYPNPFNPDTWIPYQIREDSHVVIRIYNNLGMLVRELDFGHKPVGSYTTKDKSAYWDGKNESGERVASGVYFYTIQAGEFTATRKMLMLK